MEMVVQDLKYGLRILLRKPAFTLAAVLIMGLSIGANTAIFTLVNGVLLRELPYQSPDQLVWIWMKRVDRDKAPISIPDFLDLRSRNTVLDHLSGFASWGANLTGASGPERLEGVRVSADIFETLGVRASLGRTLEPEDDDPHSQRVVVLSNSLWVRRFGGDESVIGSSLILNGIPYTIKGVLPRSFAFPATKAEVFVPLSPATDPWRTERGTNYLRAIGRLKATTSRDGAQLNLDAIAEHLREEYPDTNSGKIGTRVISLYTEIVSDFSLGLWLLLLAVISVLLIACSNLANLRLAQAAGRYKELAIRMSMGADNTRVMRQLLTENLILGLTGGVLGLLLTFWSIDGLRGLVPANLPRGSEVHVDARVLLFTLGLSVLAGILFGLAPALQTSKVNLIDGLRTEGRGSSDGPRRKALRDSLVIVEVFASLVLLIGAGLFLKSFVSLQAVDPGFRSENALTVQLPLSMDRFKEREALALFLDALNDRLKPLPGVDSISFGSILPLTGLFARCNFNVVGRPTERDEDIPVGQYRSVGRDYFRTMGIPLVKGREFTELDTHRSPPMVIINQSLADRFFPSENPLGARLSVYDAGLTPRVVEIVGVVGNVTQINLDGEPTYDVYTSLYQVPDETVAWLMHNSLNLVIRATSNPLVLEAAVRRAIASVDGDVPVMNVRSFDQLMSTSASLSTRRFYSNLLSVFACAALALAALGIYAVISQAITEQTREIGIRMALGAHQVNIFGMVVRNSMKLVSVGVVAGLLGSLLLYRLVSSLFFQVGSADPSTFAMSAVFVTLVAFVAIAWPARRATRVDPIRALHSN